MISIDCFANENRTHRPMHHELKQAVENLRNRAASKKTTSHTMTKEVDMILMDLASFPLGQHILLSGGSNGMWTDYLISPQEYLKGKGLVDLNLSVIERFFLFSSPAVLAQRELHKMLQETAQDQLGPNKTFASIPCGIMRDLLCLDYSQIGNVSLVGIDIDPESLARSKELASKLQVDQVSFVQEDAWSIQYKNTFDFISSIGLNVYEKDREKVIHLYRKFYEALKPGGILFTGVLTWPPYLDAEKSDWQLNLIPKYDMHLETIIHRDILDIQWFNFRALCEAKDDFMNAGFTNVQIKKDSRSIFPAVIARK